MNFSALMQRISVTMSRETNGILIAAVNVPGFSRNKGRKWKGREINAVKVLDHPAHSLCRAPGDFRSFLHLKQHLAGQKFYEGEKLKNEATVWLRAQLAQFCENRTQAKQMP